MPNVVTPKAGVTHDITITDPEGNETGFMLYAEDNPDGTAGTPRIVISRQPPLAPQQYQGPTRYTSQPPEVDLVWEIESFHRGGMSYRFKPGEEHRYHSADGVEAVVPGELSQSNARYAFDMHVQNGGFAASTGWTLSSASIADNKLKITTAGGNATQAVANPSAYDSRSIVIGILVDPVGDDVDVKLGFEVNSSISGHTTTTPVTDGTGPTLVTHTETLPGSITSLKVYIEMDAGSPTTCEFDDVFIYHIDAVCRDIKEYKDKLYFAIGASVMEYDPAAGTPIDVVFVGPAVCTGLGVSPADDYLVAGFGSGNGYYYSSTGAAGSYTQVTGSAVGPFVAVRNRLWGKKDNDTVTAIDDVTSTAGHVDYDDIGTTARAINSLFAVNDILVVGKEDGLWVYDRGLNDFRDITPEFQFDPDAENFERGIAWMTNLYTSTRRSVLRFNGFALEDVTSYFNGPQLDEFGGRIRAYAIDGMAAYMFADSPTSDTSATRTINVIKFDTEFDTGGFEGITPHPYWVITGGLVDSATVFTLDTGLTILVAGFRDFVSGSTYRPLPLWTFVTARHQAPVHDNNPDLPTSGTQYLITQYWDGLLPDTEKAFRLLTFRTDGTMSANQTVRVDVQVDEDTSWTTLGTATTVGAQSFYFNSLNLAQRTGKRIRFRFVIATNDSEAGPIVRGPIVLHTVYRPARLRRYTFDVKVGSNLRMRNQAIDQTTGATLVSDLDSYLDDTWPVTLKEDEDGDGTVTSHTLTINDVQRVTAFQDPVTKQHLWIYRLEGVEQKVSA